MTNRLPVVSKWLHFKSSTQRAKIIFFHFTISMHSRNHQAELGMQSNKTIILRTYRLLKEGKNAWRSPRCWSHSVRLQASNVGWWPECWILLTTTLSGQEERSWGFYIPLRKAKPVGDISPFPTSRSIVVFCKKHNCPPPPCGAVSVILSMHNAIHYSKIKQTHCKEQDRTL